MFPAQSSTQLPMPAFLTTSGFVFFFLQLKGKALYGMRQAGRCWWIFLSDILTWMVFAAMEVDQSLYILCSGGDTIATWIHVDDGVVASNLPISVSDFKLRLCAEVDIKWHDTICQIVGWECEFSEGEVAIMQRPLTKSILDAYPQRIVKSNCPLPVLPATDVAVEVNYPARHSMAPTKVHWCILDHVVGYLPKTQHHQLMTRPGKVSLNLWSDAGWGDDLKKSQTGFMLKLGNAPILWSS
ncbi:hypothetical protein O181_068689 [Austropuccinia psidii MF-1]|uniref:Reverse transcriptase Ty1/copia-type domain-containing protein n=1 Tax=Austropuccinia psidii MF-1 TaxID=1389203 RepID=A0A9Q3EXC3_9BASI|nr:hypothetical protein [Austropuccinia psidii MF-1]